MALVTKASQSAAVPNTKQMGLQQLFKVSAEINTWITAHYCPGACTGPNISYHTPFNINNSIYNHFCISLLTLKSLTLCPFYQTF